MDPATPVLAATAALGLYMYIKGRAASNLALTEGGLSPPIQVEAWRHDDVSHPPSTFAEAFQYLKEAFRWVPFPMLSAHMFKTLHGMGPTSCWLCLLTCLSRYVYTESLGRWHTMDLFIGLAYLSHRETLEYPAQDIALRGRLVSQQQTSEDASALLVCAVHLGQITCDDSTAHE